MFNPKEYIEKTKGKGENVAIIMLTYNRWELTERVLKSIFKNSFMPHTITIIDNGSWDGTIEKLKALKRQGKIHRLILLPHNMGVARGKNFGLKANREANWLVCIDNDIEILSSYWLAYLCFVANLGTYGIIGANCEKFVIPIEKKVEEISLQKCPTLGGIYAMSRATFKKVGYFREMSLYGIEDWEIGLRQWNKHGLKNCYVVPVKCRHLKEIDFKMKDEKMYEDWKKEMKSDTWTKFRSRGSDRTSITDEDIEKYTWRE